MKKWITKIRAKFIQDVAAAVENRLQSGWGKFLPPVAFRDAVYLVREDGTIYRMTQDSMRDMEIVVKIHDRF